MLSGKRRLTETVRGEQRMIVCVISFGLVSLFNGISTLFRLFNAKAILLEEEYWYYLTHSWEK